MNTLSGRTTDVGVGTVEFLLSSAVAVGCSWAVSWIGQEAENIIRVVWETTGPVPSATSGMPMLLAPAHFIHTKQVIDMIQACTIAGNNAAITVGFCETLYQMIRYANSDHDKSWGTDMLEGGYRGALVGALRGLFREGENFNQRVAAAIVGGIVGSILGNGLAGIGHIVRSVYVPKRQNDTNREK